jgi:hypothetical protein
MMRKIARSAYQAIFVGGMGLESVGDAGYNTRRFKPEFSLVSAYQSAKQKKPLDHLSKE